MLDEVKYFSRSYSPEMVQNAQYQASFPMVATYGSGQAASGAVGHCRNGNENGDQAITNRLIDLVGSLVERISTLVESIGSYFKGANSGGGAASTAPAGNGTSSSTTPAAGTSPSQTSIPATTTTIPTTQTTTPAPSQSGASTTTPAPSKTSPTTPVEAPSSSEVTGPVVDNEPRSTQLKKSGEFLWKPKSDKDGKLAILLPHKLTGKIKSVELVNAKTGKVIEKGKNGGVGNGDRTHFRFTKAGASYPDGVQVKIALNDGSFRTINMKETSARFTY